MSLKIEQAGTLSLLQDLGRNGYQDIGVTPGGPMDDHAFLWANRLLDNPPEASQVEITMGPFKARFQQATSFALCGAEVNATLNGKAISSWQSWKASAGDFLEIGYPRKGLRTYLAVKGGFVVPLTLGSVSTVLRDQFGGLTKGGVKLCNNDSLRYEENLLFNKRFVPEKFVPVFSNIVRLGVLPTYQFSQFSPEERENFFSELYEVSPQMDRMGYRLKGYPVKFKTQTFLSEGIALGAIQIPPDGQPIILMRDRQTIGGYPKMGCVCQRDLNILAQCIPGTQIRFFPQDMIEAESEFSMAHKFFFSSKSEELNKRIKRP